MIVVRPWPRDSLRSSGCSGFALAAWQVGEIKFIRIGRDRADRRADAQHGGQRLGRRLVRISYETSPHTCVGSDPSPPISNRYLTSHYFPASSECTKETAGV